MCNYTLLVWINENKMDGYDNSSFQEWMRQYGTSETCLETVAKTRWLEGFRCPRCGYARDCNLAQQRICLCYGCKFIVSPLVETLFQNTRLPLSK